MKIRRRPPVGADTYPTRHGRESIRDYQHTVKEHRLERAANGYSTRDWWNFDTFIVGLIANAVADFRTHGMGYPGHVTEGEWHVILKRIEGPLRAYANDKFDVFGEDATKQYEAAQEALRLFTEYLGHFWD